MLNERLFRRKESDMTAKVRDKDKEQVRSRCSEGD
jgi:hypothetical protein